MKPKILFISQAFPVPATSGGRIKTLATLQTLATKCTVHAVFVSESKPKAADIKKLTDLGIKLKVFHKADVLSHPFAQLKSVISGYLTLKPRLISKYYLPAAQQYVNQKITTFKPDAIHIDHLGMAQYLPSQKTQKWILETHNIESALFTSRLQFTVWSLKKCYLGIESLFNAHFEKRHFPLFDHVFAISTDDEQLLKKSFEIRNVSVQPVLYAASHRQRTYKKSVSSPRLLFIGNLWWPPNQDAISWFLHEVWPSVLRTIPSAQVDIVGEFKGRQFQVEQTLPQVTFHNYQAELASFFEQAAGFILPFRMGGGVRIKALTALSEQLPIISTKVGMQGLSAHPNTDFLLANTSQEFSKQCIRLLKTARLQSNLATAGYHYLQKNHHPSLAKAYLKQYQHILLRRPE